MISRAEVLELIDKQIMFLKNEKVEPDIGYFAGLRDGGIDEIEGLKQKINELGDA